MNESIYEQIEKDASYLGLELTAGDIAKLAVREQWTESHLDAVTGVFHYMREEREKKTIATLLRLSRLPLKEPKTFQNFDYDQLHGRHVDSLKRLSSLAPFYARQNLAFIGPEGVGKTHLAMAYGRACCERGYKTYFLKATELNQKFLDARKYGRENLRSRKIISRAQLHMRREPA